MLNVQINKTQLAALVNAAHKAKKQFRRELAIVLNKVGKKTRLDMGREVRNLVTIKKAESELPIKMKSEATESNLESHVQVVATPRLGLRHFGARQDKRGVSYKISKTGGRGRIDGAFQGPKPGAIRLKWKGNVFKRVGKTRLPIVQLKGVSVWGVYVKNDLEGPQVKAIEQELSKQMERRIEFNVLRASGLIKK